MARQQDGPGRKPIRTSSGNEKKTTESMPRPILLIAANAIVLVAGVIAVNFG